MKHFTQMGIAPKDTKDTNKTLCGPGNNKLEYLGYVTTTISFISKTTQQFFYVCPIVTQGLLWKTAISSLNLLQINSTTATQNFTKKYPQFFNGLWQNKWTNNPHQTQRIHHTVSLISTQTCGISSASTIQRGIRQNVKSRSHKEGRWTNRMVPTNCDCPERELNYPIVHKHN